MAHSALQVETFSVNAIINEKLQAPEALTKLEQLMNEVFIRRADDIPSIPYVAIVATHCFVLTDPGPRPSACLRASP